MKNHMIFKYAFAMASILLLSGCHVTPQNTSSPQETKAIIAAMKQNLPLETGIPPPTSTPIATQELPNRPVQTPSTSPNPPPQSENQAPQGFIQFFGKHTTIFLPGTFIGGSPDEDLEAILELVGFLGPNYRQAALIMAQNRDDIDLFAIDTRLSKSRTVTNLIVTEEDVPITLDIYQCADEIDAELSGLGYQVLEHDNFQMIHYPAVRLIITKAEARQVAYQAIYIIQIERAMWFLAYTTDIALAGKEQTEFDSSARTFWVLEEPSSYSMRY